MKKEKIVRVSPYMITVAIICISCVDIIRYAFLGEFVSAVTMAIVNFLFILCALGAAFGHCHLLYSLITAAAAVLFSLTNNLETTLFNFSFLLQAILSGIGGIAGIVFFVRGKVKPKKTVALFLAAILVVCACSMGTWGINGAVSNAKTQAGNEKWEVPDVFEDADNREKGTVEKISYRTKAYATDFRAVEKNAYVYLPYGYTAETKYDVLYLLHGSGDDESYWLVKNKWNKIMLDNMIEKGVIKPVIVVTPTFYVEDDCKQSAADLDKLTYSFKDELRNDLMQAVEGKYSTYAETTDSVGFIDSRAHRSFAGLSRGAVVTLHSVFCGSLDYFSSFGTFSASRTPVEDFQKSIQSEEFKDYSIGYWYVASGAFDFGLASQVSDYKALLKTEPRLEEGKNAMLDVYPMRYHSQGNWHLALYNYLQKVF